MSNNVDLTPRKTMFILVVVVGCFSVLWPKVFYPMLVGSANQQIKPSPIDKQSGCCDVISDIDINTIKIIIDLCNNIVQHDEINNKAYLGKELISKCREKVLQTCGIDIALILQQQVKLGQSVKQILNEVRSLNGSLCLKYNFGIAPWRLGVPHRVTINLANIASIRQERPAHIKPEMLHPALREKGRAIPATNNIPRRIVEGRPGPIPGMRPPMGGPGHVVPPPQKGTSTMSVVMPIYTIGIVIFFTYTLMKIMFKKPIDSTTNGLYPHVEPDPSFRKHVFESESPYINRRGKDEITTKLGWKERDTIVNAMSALLAEVDQQREEEARLRAELARQTELSLNIANGSVANGRVVKPQENEADGTSVKVLGMEMTASCEGGQKWSRPNTPLIPSTAAPPAENLPPPHSIYLEGALPPQSQLLVTDSATEEEQTDVNNSVDPAVVLSGKMTLSVISLDSLNEQENGNTIDQDGVADNIKEELIDDDDKIEESNYITASNATAAENNGFVNEEQETDDEQAEEIEED